MIALILFLFSYIIIKKNIFLRHLLLSNSDRQKGDIFKKITVIITGEFYLSKNIFSAFEILNGVSSLLICSTFFTRSI
jgi:hypothetical protein